MKIAVYYTVKKYNKHYDDSIILDGINEWNLSITVEEIAKRIKEDPDCIYVTDWERVM